MSPRNTLTIADHGVPATVRRPRTFTHQFRLGVLAEIRAGTPLAQVARCHNLGEGLVWQWKKKYGHALTGVRQPRRHRCYTQTFIDTVVASVRNGATLQATRAQYDVPHTTLMRWLKQSRTIQPPAPVPPPGSDADLERQLQALLEQYRTLHTRIERIRQLVVAA